jgi:hypothetical protein
VVRDDDRPVDGAAAHVRRGLVARIVARDDQVEHVLRPAEPRVDARHDRGEERVAEEPVVSSGTTSAIAIVARLASERAARLGT